MEAYKNKTLSPADRAEDLLKRMSLTEKAGQLNQNLYGFSVYQRDGEQLTLTEELKEEVERYQGLGVLYGLYRADPWSGRKEENGLTGRLAIQAYNLIQEYVITHSRFGIPMLLSTECPHGHQALGGYLLPVNLAMGAAFHPELVKQAYEVCGKQLKAMGVDFGLVSMLDVLRDPRWGRSEECFSEDPFLCAELAKAAVTGLQSQGVIAVAKHLAAQGEGTGGINASAARIGERELREIHLPPMKACCDVGVKGVMAAYNEIDGIPCHANPWLLQTVLKEEMGFCGIVMSDGTAADRLEVLTGDLIKAGALCVKSGVDIGLWNQSFAKLSEAVELGYLTEQELDQTVKRVLTLKFERGLFEKPYLEDETGWEAYHTDNYHESLALARESVVLLKNDSGLLPLPEKGLKRVAVIGPNAHAVYNQIGDYSPPVTNGITVYEGIRELADSLKEKLEVIYLQGSGLFDGDEKACREAAALAAESDAVILVLGGSSNRFEETVFDNNGAALLPEGAAAKRAMDCGEGVDTEMLELSAAQKQLAEAVYQASARVVTIVMGGRPYAIRQEADKTGALLVSFYPGPMGGRAIAELLFGRENPSGRLPVSIPKVTGQLPAYYNYKASYQGPKPLYSFGEGIGYGSLCYESVGVSKAELSMKELEEGRATLTVTIRNTGDRREAAVPMLFVTDREASVVPRVCQLKAFQKVWLNQGEAKTINFSITRQMLSVWNNRMQFIVEEGGFDLSLREGKEEKWKGSINVYHTKS